MKRNILLIMVIIGLMVNYNMHAQTVYRMYSNSAGRSEYLDNLRNAPMADKDTWGVRFCAGDMTRGFVNNSGQWGFLRTNSPFFERPGIFSNILRNISYLTMGVEGWLCAEAVSIRPMDHTATNTLDLLTTTNRNSITSNGDSEGLHIRSAIGHKIYLYDTIYFDHNCWTSLRPGRNNDPTILNTADKTMRIGSAGGVALWGKAGASTDDTPQLNVSGTKLISHVPMSIYPNENVRLFMGTTPSDETDGWMGTLSNSDLHIGINNSSLLYLSTDRNLYLDMSQDEVSKIRPELKNKYRFFVVGGVLSEDFAIAPKSSWSDFVFHSDYKLPVLSEVESFIKTNKHLPDVPSAEKVAEEGYSQHDMNKILLQKIEELILYTIQQQKEIEELRTQLEKTK